jgi:hypothetical protein
MSAPPTEMAATVQRISSRLRRSPDVRELASAAWYRLAGTEDRKARLIKRAKIGGPILVVVLAAALWLVFRPVPQPDYKKARLNKVFNYTLLTDEFNRLPVEKRMELIGQLVQRMKNMSAGDSTLMAAFAAGIAGAARQQIEENVSRLAIDMWDKYAKDYAAVKPENRGEFLDNTFIEFMQTMSAVSGQPLDKSPSEMLADARAQAQRDKQNLRDPDRQPPSQALGRMFNFMQGNVGGHATPTQRSRGQLMMRDMIRRMRGEDVNGGHR